MVGGPAAAAFLRAVPGSSARPGPVPSGCCAGSDVTATAQPMDFSSRAASPVMQVCFPCSRAGGSSCLLKAQPRRAEG